MFTICKSYDLSAREVIWKKSHTSLRIFRVVGKFTEMGKSPQIMGMNQQVTQHLHLHVLRPNWSLSGSNIMRD